MKKQYFILAIFIVSFIPITLNAQNFWSWGYNWYGQLGDGTDVAKNTPTQVSSTAVWKMVVAGDSHCIALKSDGTLWAWGANGYGQLGDGTILYKKTPIQIGTSSDWKTVETGAMFTLAIKNNGTLWAWGQSASGQLGNGTTSPNLLVPTQIGTSSDWKTLSAGLAHVLAIKTDGTLWGWGANDKVELGNGVISNYVTSPIQIGTSTDWKAVAAGSAHSVALKTDNTLWGCGSNGYGQLGDANSANKITPTQIGTSQDWKTVVAGANHTLALKADGSLWVCGYNYYGQIGNGSTTHLKALTMVGASSDWESIDAAERHTIAIKTNGTLWAWGGNNYSQLGDGTSVDKKIPTQIGTGTDWKTIIAGGFFNILFKTSLTGFAENVIPKIELYPNPTSDGFYIKGLEGEVTLTITNLDGKLLLTRQIIGNEKISIKMLPKGLYLVKLTTGKATIKQKIIKK